MRKETLFLPLAVTSSLLMSVLLRISAFVPLTVQHRVGIQHISQDLQCQRQSWKFVNSRAFRSISSRQWASAEDEEDDEDDEDEKQGPLSKGIDSVSWLPSVIGAKGDNMPITSAKEVRVEICHFFASVSG
jgi:hypothetical protein